jgi:NB-ARC domain
MRRWRLGQKVNGSQQWLRRLKRFPLWLRILLPSIICSCFAYATYIWVQHNNVVSRDPVTNNQFAVSVVLGMLSIVISIFLYFLPLSVGKKEATSEQAGADVNSQAQSNSIQAGKTSRVSNSTHEEANDTLPVSPMNQLPAKSYRELVGREVLVGNIMAALRDVGGKWIVAIDGMGGIGKTSLAYEVGERCLSEHLCDEIVWMQSSKSEPTSGKARNQSNTLAFDTALNTIGRQLRALEVARLDGAEKEARIRALLHARRVLLILDNLETAGEPQNQIALRLEPLVNRSKSKALLTSRRRFEGEVYSVHLEGLEKYDALRFVYQEARERNIARVLEAKSEGLEPIAISTGGSPLALKLVVGQLNYLSVEVVLNQLREVHLPLGEADEDDYIRFYKFIFLPSWKLLSSESKKLLISMTCFVPGIGGAVEAIKAVSSLSDDLLSSSIKELWRLSFLEVGDSPSLKHTRYYLHALTQYFVLSDIVRTSR